MDEQALALLERFVAAHEEIAQELFYIRQLAEASEAQAEERWAPTNYREEEL